MKKTGAKKSRKKEYKKTDVDAKIARYIIIAAVLINFILLIPLFDGWCLVAGDGTIHYANAQAMKFSLDSENGVFGTWTSFWALGFPAYDYYQYFLHFFWVILHYISFQLLSILTIEKLLIVLAVAFFPVSLFYGLRKLGMESLPAAFAALFSFALSSSVGHGGIGFSLIHHGVVTQLIGIFLFPVVLARVYISVSEGRSYFLSVLSLSLILLIHPIAGYAAGISCLLFIFMKERLRSSNDFMNGVARLAFIMIPVFIVVSHFFVPLLLGSDYYGGAFYTGTSDYYASNAPQVIFDFFTGRTLDFYRFPFSLLTIFFFIGLYITISGREKRQFPLFVALAGFVTFLLISFGRSFWGILFDLMPGMNFILVFRLVFALQFFALFFVGAGMAFLFTALHKVVSKSVRKGSAIAVMFIFIMLLAIPVFAQVFLTNQKLCTMVNSGFDEENFSKVVLFLRNAPDGRFISRPELGFSSPYYEALLPIYTSHDSFSSPAMGTQDNLAFFYTQYFMLPSHMFYDLFNIRYVLMPSDREPPFSFQNDTFIAGNYTIYSVDTTGFFDLVDSKTALIYDGAMTYDFVRSVNRAWLNTYAMEKKELITMFRRGQDIDKDSYSWVIDEQTNTFTDDEIKKKFKDRSKPRLPKCGSVLKEDHGLDRYVVAVNTNRSCLLLFKMSYHPAWHAMIGGEDVGVLAVSPSFMAVPVESGLTSIEFYYKEDLTMEYWLIACAILVLLGIFMYDFGTRN